MYQHAGQRYCPVKECEACPSTYTLAAHYKAKREGMSDVTEVLGEMAALLFTAKDKLCAEDVCKLGLLVGEIQTLSPGSDETHGIV